MMAEDYPPESWTRIYTDGSATAAIKDGGAGMRDSTFDRPGSWWFSRAYHSVLDKVQKIAASPKCSCGQDNQTAEHILQQCPLLEQQSKALWPVLTGLRLKLYGAMEDMTKTATFIDVAGLRL